MFYFAKPDPDKPLCSGLRAVEAYAQPGASVGEDGLRLLELERVIKSPNVPDGCADGGHRLHTWLQESEIV